MSRAKRFLHCAVLAGMLGSSSGCVGPSDLPGCEGIVYFVSKVRCSDDPRCETLDVRSEANPPHAILEVSREARVYVRKKDCVGDSPTFSVASWNSSRPEVASVVPVDPERFFTVETVVTGLAPGETNLSAVVSIPGSTSVEAPFAVCADSPCLNPVRLAFLRVVSGE